MLVKSPPNAPVEPPPVEALDTGVIEEARRRQRRHRGIGGVAVTLVAAVVAGVTLWLPGGSGTPGPSGALAASVLPPLTGEPLGPTVLRLIVADTPPVILDLNGARLTTIRGVVPGPYRTVGAPQVTSVSATRSGAFAVVDRACRACANESGFFIGQDGSVTAAANGQSIALDPGTTKVWVLDSGRDGHCTLQLVPSSHRAVPVPCGLIQGATGTNVLIGREIVDPFTGAVRFRAAAEQSLYLLQDNLALESNTVQQFNGQPGALALINLDSGARQPIGYPNMARGQESDSFNLQKIAVEPHGPLVALTFVDVWFPPSQAAYVWVLNVRTGRLALLPGFPVQEGIKFSDAEWTSNDRLVVVSQNQTATTPTSTVLGIWTPGQTTLAVRSVPSAPSYWSFVALGG
jgi:hypothetical protein